MASAPVVGVRRLLVLVLFLLDDDQALLQDLVEAGLDVVGLEVVVVLVVVVVGLADGGRGDATGTSTASSSSSSTERVVDEIVVVGEDVLVEVLEVLFVELFGLVDLVVLDQFLVVISHGGAECSATSSATRQAFARR